MSWQRERMWRKKEERMKAVVSSVVAEMSVRGEQVSRTLKGRRKTKYRVPARGDMYHGAQVEAMQGRLYL